MPMQAPEARCGVVACTASPISTTRPCDQGRGSSRPSSGRKTICDCSVDLLADALQHRRREGGQQPAQVRGEGGRVDMFVGGPRLGDEEVHLGARHRVHAGLDLRAQPHGGGADLGRRRQHRAPHGLAAVAGLRRLREQGLAQLGVEAIGTDHQVVAPALAVGEADFHALGILLERGEGAAQAHVSARLPAWPGPGCRPAPAA
jgi:hypothetical protein